MSFETKNDFLKLINNSNHGKTINEKKIDE